MYTGPNIITNGLVLCLDAANKLSYPGSGTVWSDLSGFGNTGTLTNGPTFNSGNGGSIVFDGVNDYVSSAFSVSSRPFSIDAWIFFTSLVGYQTVVGQDTDQVTPFGRFYFQKLTNSGTSPPRVNNTFGVSMVTNASAEVYCYDPTPVVSSLWYNYCISISTTDLTLFKNGTQVTNVVNNATLASPTGNTLIGAGYYNSAIGDYTNARVANVKIYNRALSATEVQQNYEAVKTRFGL